MSSDPQIQPSQEEREDLLEHYLRDIRHIRVLDAEEEVEFSKRIQRGERVLRETMLSVPFCARVLHQRWQEIREAGRVTATLAAVRRPDGADDRSGEIDALFERIGASLARRDQITRKRSFDPASPTPTVRRMDTALAELLHQVEPRSDLLFEVYLELRARLDELKRRKQSVRRARGERGATLAEQTRQLECELGLAAKSLEALLAEAAEGLADLADARETFVRHNLKLVVSVAKDFRNMGVSFLDLIQEGNTGLLRAVEKFDHRQGCRFSTYGVWWIRQSCIRAIQNTSRTVRLPTNLHDRLLRFRRAAAQVDGDPESPVGIREIARLLETDADEIEALIRYDRRPLGLDDTVAGTEELTVGDRLEDEDVVPADELADEARLELAVPALLENLPERERRVLEWRFGLGGSDERTLQDIGDELGLSRERVRQIERGGLDRLRDEAERRGLDSLVLESAA